MRSLHASRTAPKQAAVFDASLPARVMSSADREREPCSPLPLRNAVGKATLPLRTSTHDACPCLPCLHSRPLSPAVIGISKGTLRGVGRGSSQRDIGAAGAVPPARDGRRDVGAAVRDVCGAGRGRGHDAAAVRTDRLTAGPASLLPLRCLLVALEVERLPRQQAKSGGEGNHQLHCFLAIVGIAAEQVALERFDRLPRVRAGRHAPAELLEQAGGRVRWRCHGRSVASARLMP